MNPKHQQMATKECEEVRLQGLIKLTTSAWVYHVFDVNKRSEYAREKAKVGDQLPTSQFFPRKW